MYKKDRKIVGEGFSIDCFQHIAIPQYLIPLAYGPNSFFRCFSGHNLR